jgi:hypothetical protein
MMKAFIAPGGVLLGLWNIEVRLSRHSARDALLFIILNLRNLRNLCYPGFTFPRRVAWVWQG